MKEVLPNVSQNLGIMKGLLLVSCNIITKYFILYYVTYVVILGSMMVGERHEMQYEKQLNSIMLIKNLISLHCLDFSTSITPNGLYLRF